jgi:flagellin
MALGLGGIQTSSLFAQNALRTTGLAISLTTAQLSSGNRLVNAAVDASGLAMSQFMRAQLGGMDQAINNAQDTVNLTQTAGSTLSNQQEILGSMRDLAVRSANSATLTPQDQATLNNEFQSLNAELTRSGQASSFNGKQLTTDVPGQQYGTQQAQVGPNATANDQISVTINPSTAATLNAATPNQMSIQDISTTAGAQGAITAIDQAISQVSNQQASLGVQQNVLQYQTNDLENNRINVAAANSRIADTNFASAITEQTTNLLLQKVSMAALSQTNAQAFGVLKLLGV